MSGASVAFLLRYLIMAVSLGLTALLLRQALKDFRGGIQAQVQPTYGFFLVAESTGQASKNSHRYLPLFHTTTLGRHFRCDIRLKHPSVLLRHATIYLYDGDWYLQPIKSSGVVKINGVSIAQATPLRHNDQLSIGDISLLFMSEKLAGVRLSEQYAKRQLALNPNLFLKQPGSPLAWWLFQVLYGLMTVACYAQLSGDLLVLRRPTLAILGAFWIIFNLYYLFLSKLFKYFDRIVWLSTLFMMTLGLVIQFRLTLLWPRLMDEVLSENGHQIFKAMISLLAPQYLALALGLILMPIVMVVACRTRFLEMLYPVCLVITPLLLVATLVLGTGDEQHGATLWLRIGGMSIQLTEFAKLTYIIVLATFFKTRPKLSRQLCFALWAGTVMFLIMLLPDLGSIMILLPVTLVVYVVMTSEYWTTLAILIGGTSFGALAFALFPHVRNRLSGWTTLWQEVNDSNRQIVYGLQAMARGGLMGRGIGNGSPDGIPVVASDMVFTVLCEDLGLLVGLCVVVAFIIIWLRGAKNMILVKDGFTSSLTLAISTMFFFESAIVIAGCTGLMPLTGVTLPFIAQGGSSLLAKLILMGIFLGLMTRRAEMVVSR